MVIDFPMYLLHLIRASTTACLIAVLCAPWGRGDEHTYPSWPSWLRIASYLCKDMVGAAVYRRPFFLKQCRTAADKNMLHVLSLRQTGSRGFRWCPFTWRSRFWGGSSRPIVVPSLYPTPRRSPSVWAPGWLPVSRLSWPTIASSCLISPSLDRSRSERTPRSGRLR